MQHRWKCHARKTDPGGIRRQESLLLDYTREEVAKILLYLNVLFTIKGVFVAVMRKENSLGH